jgi:hypothetical protein
MLPAMEPLTLEMLRTMARAQGLTLTDRELESLLPLVQAGRALLGALPPLPPDAEPALQYRLF